MHPCQVKSQDNHLKSKYIYFSWGVASVTSWNEPTASEGKSPKVPYLRRDGHRSEHIPKHTHLIVKHIWSQSHIRKLHPTVHKVSKFSIIDQCLVHNIPSVWQKLCNMAKCEVILQMLTRTLRPAILHIPRQPEEHPMHQQSWKQNIKYNANHDYYKRRWPKMKTDRKAKTTRGM